jgi:flagellar motor protein MotB
VPEKSEWQQIAEDLHQAYECQQVMLGLINTHTECGQCEAAIARFNKGNTMDKDEWKKAIDNANTYAKKYYTDKQHQEFIVQDAEYWRKKYLDETIETMRLRKQCWELRDKLADIKVLIRTILKKADK